MLTIIDLLKDDSIWDQFLEVLEEIDDELKDNYTIKNLRLDEMICFPVLFKNDDIVCFSGMQKISDQIYRVATRYYIRKKYREHFVRSHSKRQTYHWKYLVPYQLEMAKGKTTIFTTHLCKSDRSFQYLVNEVSKSLGRKVTYVSEEKIFGNKIQKVAVID